MHRCLSLVLSVSPLVGQTQVVSPVTYINVEGNSSTSIPFAYAAARVQQVDANLIGMPMAALARMEFRRDGASAATARTSDVTILMGTGDVNTFSATFASNWLSGPTTVYTRKPTNLPDLGPAPVPPPAPFGVVLPFDVPFAYNGTEALLWEIVGENATSTATYAMDWTSGAATVTGPATSALGTGCTTPQGMFALTMTTRSTTTLDIGFGVTGAPASAPLLLMLGLTDLNLPYPGLCQNLRTDLLATLPFGAASATGSLATTYLSTANATYLLNVTLLGQMAAPDASQTGLPIALSNGRQGTTPNRFGGPAPTNVKRTFNLTSITNPTGSTPSVSAAVTRYTF